MQHHIQTSTAGSQAEMKTLKCKPRLLVDRVIGPDNLIAKLN